MVYDRTRNYLTALPIFCIMITGGKMKILLGKNERFYKANLHCHSTKSDGYSTVERIKEVYKAAGYSIVAFTDHDAIRGNSHLTDDDFLAITSFELSIKEDPFKSTLVAQKMKCAHFNLYALEEDNLVTPCYDPVYDKVKSDEVRYESVYNRTFSADGVNDIIKTAHEKGFLICLNHPSWSLLDATDYLGYEGLDMVEIVNYSCAAAGHADDENVLEVMARHGKRVFCVAADDAHSGESLGKYGSDSLGGFVMVDAPKLEYGAVMNALKNGDFYASTGPEIYSIVRDGKSITVKCSDAAFIYLSTESRVRKRAIAEENGTIREASFDLGDTYDLFRIVVEDEKGNRAYSQFYNVN